MKEIKDYLDKHGFKKDREKPGLVRGEYQERYSKIVNEEKIKVRLFFCARLNNYSLDIVVTFKQKHTLIKNATALKIHEIITNLF